MLILVMKRGGGRKGRKASGKQGRRLSRLGAQGYEARMWAERTTKGVNLTTAGEENEITCEATGVNIRNRDVVVGFAGEVLVGQLDQRFVVHPSCSSQNHARRPVVRAHVGLQVFACY